MLESLPVMILVGTILGFLAGLGVGGGSLLIIWLTTVLTVHYPEARGINLLFFLPSAAIACLFRRKQGDLDFPRILPAVIAGCVSAGAFAYLSTHMDITLLKKLFGGLLIFTGLRELFYKPKRKRTA